MGLRLKEWPMCTAHFVDCAHTIMHTSSLTSREFARGHQEMVNKNGMAICTCHPPEEAERLGVVPFECDQGRKARDGQRPG